MGPSQEIYSIDESFIGLDGVRGDLKARALAVRERILRWVGIPCCVGIGSTKTLAKFANHVAKQAERKPGSYPAEHACVCDLSTLTPAERDALLAATEVGELWGDDPDRYLVGRDTSASLRFGVGRHFCLGASLARLEARVCLEELVARVKDWSIDPDGIERVHSVNVRGFAALPTTVEAR